MFARSPLEVQILALDLLHKCYLSLPAPLLILLEDVASLEAVPLQKPGAAVCETFYECTPAFCSRYGKSIIRDGLHFGFLGAFIERRRLRAFFAPDNSSVCKHEEQVMVSRLLIYLVPNDLPRLRSELRKTPANKFGVNSMSAWRKMLDALETLRIKSEESTGSLIADKRQLLVPRRALQQTLIDLWNQVPSPVLTKPLPNSSPFWLKRIMEDLASSDNELNPIPLLRTRLYAYQRAAVYTALFREWVPSFFDDPTRTQHVDCEGRRLYIDSDTLAIFSSTSSYSAPKGGIFAERAGGGKSLEVLSLIAATKNRLPPLEGDILGTSLHLPQCEVVGHPERTERGVPSLQSTCIRLIRRENHLLPTLRLHGTGDTKIKALGEQIDCIPVCYRLPGSDDIVRSGVKTRATRASIQKSLAPSPPFTNTVNRDFTPRRTIQDSVEDAEDERDELEPEADRIADFSLLPNDMGLVYRSEVGQEIRSIKTSLIIVPSNLINFWTKEIRKHFTSVFEHKFGRSDHECLYSVDNLTFRVIRQSDKGFPSAQQIAKADILLMTRSAFKKQARQSASGEEILSTSILRTIRFARIVIDEGDIASGKSQVVHLLQTLHSNSVWLMSATPTTNLNARYLEDAARVNIEDVADKLDKHSQLRGDLIKIGKLAAFVGMRPFCRDGRAFERLTKPFLSHSLNDSALQAVLDQLIIRTEPRLISSQLDLPPQRYKRVIIDWSDLDAKVYNGLVALASSNYLLSEGEGPDSFADPKNAVYRNTLEANLRQAHTFYSDESLLDWLRDAKDRVQDALQAPARAMSNEEIGMLERVSATLRSLCSDPQLSQLCHSLETSDLWYRVENENLNHTKIFTIEHLLGFRPGDLASERSHSHMVGHQFWRMAEYALRTCVKNVRENAFDQTLASQFVALKEKEDAQLADMAKRASQKRSVAVDENLIPTVLRARDQLSIPSEFRIPPHSELLSYRIISTASGKINFIISEILSSHDDDYFLIYTDLPLAFYQVSTSLSLAGITFLSYYREDHTASRNGEATTAERFQSSGDYKVLLLTPKKGAKGLHLTRANKIIFLSPLWSRSEEYQASMRAHRIGQTRECEVQILCMRDSFELALFNRREEIEKGAIQQEKNHAMLHKANNDKELQTFLQSAHFVLPNASSPKDEWPTGAGEGYFFSKFNTWATRSNLAAEDDRREIHDPDVTEDDEVAAVDKESDAEIDELASDQSEMDVNIKQEDQETNQFLINSTGLQSWLTTAVPPPHSNFIDRHAETIPDSEEESDMRAEEVPSLSFSPSSVSTATTVYSPRQGQASTLLSANAWTSGSHPSLKSKLKTGEHTKTSIKKRARFVEERIEENRVFKPEPSPCENIFTRGFGSRKRFKTNS